MPRAKSICLVSGCVKPTTGYGRCDDHRLPRDKWGKVSKRNTERIPGWAKTRLIVLRRDRYHCYVCGEATAVEVDHIVPIARGGSHELTNLAAVCPPCHRRKTALESRVGPGS